MISKVVTKSYIINHLAMLHTSILKWYGCVLGCEFDNVISHNYEQVNYALVESRTS